MTGLRASARGSSSVLPHRLIEKRLRAVVSGLFPDASMDELQVRPCPDPKFGDYQVSAIMGLAKARKTAPRPLAEQVRAALDLTDLCESVEIAGAGFLNFRLRGETMASALGGALRGEHLFFEPDLQPQTVVIDFSSPNVAKPMHVGHIRSTVLGDCLSRLYRLLGHRVITDNHIGDWGTQFGKLIVGWKKHLDPAALERDPISEMERLYRLVNSAGEKDPAVLDEARHELLQLQQGNEENLALWREMIRLSQSQFDTMYGRLGVTFDHTLGESFYNPRLASVVADLRAKGVARESEGAICVFSDGSLPPKDDPFLIQRDGEWTPNPCLVQKSDGAANYATTDLATLDYRIQTWNPSVILYVTDGRQQLHFRQLFAAFRQWQPGVKARFEHVWFGSILGEDGKPFKTRAGDTVKLGDLLDEAEERALAVVNGRNPNAPEAARRHIARVIGLAAVKYADLLPNRQSDYTFSWEKMLALNGNTAVYLLYACARVRSLLRKASADFPDDGPFTTPSLSAPEEIALARHLLNYGLVLRSSAEECRPNYLCNYLYELAGLFARFWENCPVLKASAEDRRSRLALCKLAGEVLKQGLETLGIETLDQM